MTEQDALAYLFRFINNEDRSQRQRGPGFSLDGMYCLLEVLDHPERAYPSVVIAGSKGKGSTSAMLAAILTAAGQRTGLYTQPHLQSWRERVRVDGEPMPVVGFVAAVERLQALVPELPRSCPTIAQPTYYELGTAVALLHFAAVPVDLAVLEIGLGGRLDSVNTVTPTVSAITPISLEHTDILGDTLAAIAGEKAGIVKPGVPVVVAPQPPAAAAVIERVARDQGAPLIWAAERCQVSAGPVADTTLALAGRQSVAVHLPAGLARAGLARRRSLTLPLLGQHQWTNAMTALAIAEVLADQGWPIDAAVAGAGLERVRWPGRLEVMQTEPLVVVDAAHTPESAAKLVAALGSHFPGRAVTFILAVSNDKDIDGIAAALVPAAARLLVTAYGQARATPAAAIAAAIGRAGGRAELLPSVAAALKVALADATATDLICVTGSLVTVGEARAWLGHEVA